MIFLNCKTFKINLLMNILKRGNMLDLQMIDNKETAPVQ